MIIHEINNEQIWDDFFNQHSSPSFHHAWEWGDFNKAQKYEILRLGVYEKNDLIAIALVIKILSKRGRFYFIPHGPIMKLKTEKLAQAVQSESDFKFARKVFQELTDFLSQRAKSENVWFIRIAPILKDAQVHQRLFRELDYRKAPIYMHAERMWVVDISKSEDEILKDMRKNTRYYVRRAKRDGVTVDITNSIKALDDFWKLYTITSDRAEFVPFPKQYIQHEFEAFNAKERALFFLCGVPSKIAPEAVSETIPTTTHHRSQNENMDDRKNRSFLAASLVLFTTSAGFYHQGASMHTKIPAPYLLQWSSILEAKRRGCSYYSLYGIHIPGRTPKAWEGLSLFKKGFGGFQVDYLPTQDFVLSPYYYFSYATDMFLKWRRGIKIL